MSIAKLKETLLLGSEKRNLQSDMMAEQIFQRIQTLPNEEQKFLDFITYQHYYNHTILPLFKYDEIISAPVLDEAINCVSDDYDKVLHLINMQDHQIKGFYLRQWVTKVAQKQKRCNPLSILDIIKTAESFNLNLRKKVFQIIGNRGRYILSLFPNEKYQFELKETLWTEGKIEERKTYLEDLCKKDANKAFQLINASWSSMNAREKISFLKIVNDYLQPELEGYIENWLSEFKGVFVDKAFTKQLKSILCSYSFRLDPSKLTPVKNALDKYVLKPENGFFSKLIKGKEINTLRLPKANDDFWNGENMNKSFGVEEKNPDIGIYDYDSYFWFTCLVEQIPFTFWIDLLEGDDEQVLNYFLSNADFQIKINQQKKSFLQQAIIENAKNNKDKKLLSLLSKRLPTNDVEQFVQLLDKDDFENFIITHNLYHRTDLFTQRSEFVDEKWSLTLAKKVINYAIEQSKASTYYYNRSIGLSLSMFLDEAGFQEFNRTNERIRTESWYHQFKENITQPVQMGYQIRNLLSQL